MTNIQASLAELASAGHPVAGYTELLESLMSASQDTERFLTDFRLFLEAVLREEVNLVTSRQILNEIYQAVDPVNAPDQAKAILQATVDAMASRAVSFEDQITIYQEKLASIYEDEEDWRHAARALQGIPLESGHRAISAQYRLKTYIKIVRLLLSDDDPIGAETYLSRAASSIHDHGDQEDQIHFQLSQARILDAKRRFIEASTKYYRLSFESLVSEEERNRCLAQAVICAIMAAAGPQRSRVLATLYKDDRAHQLSTFLVLEKVYLDRVLSREEVESFSSELSEHHLAKLADGTTVLDRAILEHNLLSISKVYDSIRDDELGRLLGVPSDRAGRAAAKMMGENRMHGSIDQVEGVIEFEDNPSNEASGAKATKPAVVTGGDVLGIPTTEAGEPASARAFFRWDEKLQSLCGHVEEVVTLLGERHPEWVKNQVS